MKDQSDYLKEDLIYHDEKLTNVRKIIAKNMHSSLTTMAQLTNHSFFNATKILEYIKGVKAGGGSITINDTILFMVSRVIKKHPYINAHFLEDKIRIFDTVNLGVAVDTEKRGLLVPTLYNAEKKSLNEISKEVKILAKEARSGRIAPFLLENGTFTVTNLGKYGVESFTPIINPPQTAILGIGSIETRVKDINGELDPYLAMGISLTYDHQAVDGASAARFAKELTEAFENFDCFV